MTGKLIGLWTASFLVLSSLAADFKITTFLLDGSLTVTNSYPEGVVTVLGAPAITGPWVPLRNAFSLANSAQLEVAPPGSSAVYRTLAVDISGSGSWLFSPDDIVDLSSFVDTLSGGGDNVSAFLDSDPGILEDLYSYGTSPDSEVAAALAGDLNTFVQGPSIYDAALFAGVSLSPPPRHSSAKTPRVPEFLASTACCWTMPIRTN